MSNSSDELKIMQLKTAAKNGDANAQKQLLLEYCAKHNFDQYQEVEEVFAKLKKISQQESINKLIESIQGYLRNLPAEQRKFLAYASKIMPESSYPSDEKEIVRLHDELKKRVSSNFPKNIATLDSQPIDKIIIEVLKAPEYMESKSITNSQIAVLCQFVFKMIELKINKQASYLHQQFILSDMSLQENQVDTFDKWMSASRTWGARSDTTKKVDMYYKNYKVLKPDTLQERLKQFQQLYLLQQSVDEWLVTRRGTRRTDAMVALKKWVDQEVVMTRDEINKIILTDKLIKSPDEMKKIEKAGDCYKKKLEAQAYKLAALDKNIIKYDTQDNAYVDTSLIETKGKNKDFTAYRELYREIEGKEVGDTNLKNYFQALLGINIAQPVSVAIDSNKISQTNLFSEQESKETKDQRAFSEYKGKEDDYSRIDERTDTAINEIQGDRRDQEDRVVTGKVVDLAHLEEKEIVAALKSTVASLQQLTEPAVNLTDYEENPRNNNAGTTLSSVVTCGNKMYTTNVGDSTAFVAIINKKNNSVQVERLQEQLHSPNNDEEKDKALSRGSYKLSDGYLHRSDNRDNRGISILRALGDNYMGDHFSHEADVYVKELTLGEDESAVIINACDGVTERIAGKTDQDKKANSEKWIAEVIKADPTRLPQALAKKLVEGAYELGSTDNISVTVTPFDPKADPRYIAVFDGHSGAVESDKLSKVYGHTLQENINQFNPRRTISFT